MTEIHVVFGTGPLGKWTARELARLGKQVRMINRSGNADRLPESIEVIASDAYDVKKNIELTQGASAIYQCAQPHYYEWTQKFRPLQKAILEAAVTNGAKLIVGDNLYMYGSPHGQLIREDSPVRPNSKKGQVRAEMAQVVMDAHEKGRVRAAIGRASDFFGPDDHDLTSFAILPAVQNKPVNLIGNIHQPHTFTYVADFGKLLATLGTRDEALGQVWFAPSNAPLTQAELMKLLEAELGHSVKARVGGPMMMRFLGLFNREIKETVEMIFEWMEPYVMDSSQAQNIFGLQPTPMKEAIQLTLEWCKEVALKENQFRGKEKWQKSSTVVTQPKRTNLS
jgi:nucleoside-diphosphate-sugar epimerase